MILPSQSLELSDMLHGACVDILPPLALPNMYSEARSLLHRLSTALSRT